MNDTGNGLLDETVKKITPTLKVDRERLEATFTFTPPSEADNELLAHAVERILYRYFKIIVAASHLTTMKTGRPMQFIDDSVIGLPSRTVNVVLQANLCLLKIEGKDAIDGKDGASELFYSWKKEAGQIDERGNIDLKRTNAFAGVNKGDLLATIHCKTDGQPGITVDGKRIKQRLGKPLTVKWNEQSVRREDDPNDLNTFHLYAGISGLVQSSFQRNNAPETLRELKIQEFVTIHGDVNYGIGNQGVIDGQGTQCTFSLDIKGNVKGAFSLQSNGFIHVKGTIEGKKVTAREITADFITGGCVAQASESISVASIVNATANAPQITVSRNASGSTLRAETVILTPKANFVGMTVETTRLESSQNHFSGRTRIAFNPQLFEQFTSLTQAIRNTQQKAREAGTPNREIAAAMLTDIARIESIIDKKRTPSHQEITAMIVDIKIPVLNAIQTAGKSIGEEMIKQCYRLQAILSDNRYDESLLIKLDSLVAHSKRYNAMARQLATILEGQSEQQGLLAQAEADIRNNLILAFKSPAMIGQNSSLLVQCGTIEKYFNATEISGSSIEIRYVPPPAGEDISQGQIVLMKG